MAKSKPEALSIDSVFDGARKSSRKAIKRQCFAVRMSRGPKGAKYESLVIEATDGVDARRQWFNFYGLNEETYRYALQAVALEEGHPLAGDAIRCASPRVGGGTTMADLANQAFEDQTEMLKTGETRLVETM